MGETKYLSRGEVMTALICAYDDCENEVREEDYCEECGCYICEEHNWSEG
jgi:hypothetical protein